MLSLVILRYRSTCMFLQHSWLWSGEFGIVYKGYIVEDTTDIVAIKTLKGYGIISYIASYLTFRLHIPWMTGFYDHSTSEELVRECIKMKDLNHPNILRLIGICVDGGPAPFIITPFMENGSLLSYLRKNRNTFLLPTEDNVTTRNFMINWCDYTLIKFYSMARWNQSSHSWWICVFKLLKEWNI